MAAAAFFETYDYNNTVQKYISLIFLIFLHFFLLNICSGYRCLDHIRIITISTQSRRMKKGLCRCSYSSLEQHATDIALLCIANYISRKLCRVLGSIRQGFSNSVLHERLTSIQQRTHWWLEILRMHCWATWTYACRRMLCCYGRRFCCYYHEYTCGY